MSSHVLVVVPNFKVILEREVRFNFMFSLIYYEEDKFGILDNRYLSFQIFDSKSFMSVLSMYRDRELSIRGVSKCNGAYTFEAVPFEEKPNMFNLLPFVKNEVISISDITILQEYDGYFASLSDLAQSDACFECEYICKLIGMFAYIHLCLKKNLRIPQSAINDVIFSLGEKNERVYTLLCTEPNPNDVMEKFRCKPMLLGGV